MQWKRNLSCQRSCQPFRTQIKSCVDEVSHSPAGAEPAPGGPPPRAVGVPHAVPPAGVGGGGCRRGFTADESRSNGSIEFDSGQ